MACSAFVWLCLRPSVFPWTVWMVAPSGNRQPIPGSRAGVRAFPLAHLLLELAELRRDVAPDLLAPRRDRLQRVGPGREGVDRRPCGVDERRKRVDDRVPRGRRWGQR